MLDRLFGRKREEVPASAWAVQSFSGSHLYALPGGSLLGITGERHHRAEVERTLQSAPKTAPAGLDHRAADVARTEQGKLCWFSVELIPAPENPYDENAVEVRTQWGLVGYIDRDHALEFRPVFELLTKQGYGGALVSGFGRPGENQIVICLSFADICQRHLRDELVCRVAWDALHAGENAAAVAERFGYANTGSLRRSVRAYARNHGLPDPEAKKL